MSSRLGTIYRVGCSTLTISALSLIAILLLVTISWKQILHHVNDVETCSSFISVCVPNEDVCNDSNDCTLDRSCHTCEYKDTFGTYCDHRLAENGIDCKNTCYVNGTSSCSNGKCVGGTCIGQCTSRDGSSCPLISSVLLESVQVLLDDTFFIQEQVCDYGVCSLFIGPIWNILGDFASPSPSAWDDSCNRLIDHSKSLSTCLDSYMWTMTGVPDTPVGVCVIRFSCAKYDDSDAVVSSMVSRKRQSVASTTSISSIEGSQDKISRFMDKIKQKVQQKTQTPT